MSQQGQCTRVLAGLGNTVRIGTQNCYNTVTTLPQHCHNTAGIGRRHCRNRGRHCHNTVTSLPNLCHYTARIGARHSHNTTSGDKCKWHDGKSANAQESSAGEPHWHVITRVQTNICAIRYKTASYLQCRSSSGSWLVCEAAC